MVKHVNGFTSAASHPGESGHQKTDLKPGATGCVKTPLIHDPMAGGHADFRSVDRRLDQEAREISHKRGWGELIAPSPWQL